MQLLSKEISSTPSLRCPDHMTDILFLDKSILKFLQKQKEDGVHCQFSELLCLLIMIPMFILNYRCFIRNIIWGTNNFVHQTGSCLFRKILFSFNYFSLQTEPEINHFQGSNVELLKMALYFQNSSFLSFFLARKIPICNQDLIATDGGHLLV